MPKNRETNELVQEINQTRQQRAHAFGVYLKGLVIDWQYRNREWITSATELGKILGVSDVTANDWIKGKTLPRREQVVRIASILRVSPVEALEAAGYPASQDDSYNTYAVIIAAVEQDTTLSEQKRQRLLKALFEILDPAFATQAREWDELATLILHQKASALSKAEKLAGIVDLWHQQQDGN
jgi:hypothetical protein